MFKKLALTLTFLLLLITTSYGEYLTIIKGATSQIVQIPVFDSSSSVGAMLTGLVYNSSNLVCYYNRTGASGSAVQISLVTATKGTWTSSGFVAVDGTNMPGWYELDIPDAALLTGADSVSVNCKGAANMVPVPILIKLADTVTPSNVTQWNGSNVATPTVAGYPLVDVSKIAGTTSAGTAGYIGIDWGHINAPTTTMGLTNTTVGIVSTLTGNTAQTGDAYSLLNTAAGEPGQGAPNVSLSPIDKIRYIYKFMRNKVRQSSTTTELYNNGGTVVDQKSTVSDDGTYFNKGEYGSGP